MNAFDRLAPEVRKWIRGKGWRELRPVQASAVHAILDHPEGDAIIAAATAGGKTEAAFLPLVSRVLSGERRGGFDLLYIGPLKALINDQQARLEDLCRNTDLPVWPWHGDVQAQTKKKALGAARGILLITPESLEAMFILRGNLMPALFAGTAAVVIDELHTLLDSERGVHLRSLLARLEIATGRRIPRIGLSATLGDMELAKAGLRPHDPASVRLIEAGPGGAELKVHLRGYVAGDRDPDAPAPVDAIARHLFSRLRGSNNLVFATSRHAVETYADRLRVLGEEARLPQEFFPHHASLAGDHRAFVEQRLKDSRLPTTAICTSTLELGIDIGDVECVAQIGPPWTVASLRQRMGRSGRRGNRPAILRQYVIEAALEANSSPADRLRLGLVRAIAMIDLLGAGWCEPPGAGALHLSTLVHQVLAVIAERGGASVKRLHRTLCVKGPFSAVDTATFLALLRRLGEPGVGLIEQESSGLLLLGPAGEKLVGHHGFYAVFTTPEEYRLVADGTELGTMPVSGPLAPGMTIIFSGRRWEVTGLAEGEKVILLRPARGGTPPVFGGDAGAIHDAVVARMFKVLGGAGEHRYLDATARRLLAEGRAAFRRYGLAERRLVEAGEHTVLIATRRGTVTTRTLALALTPLGFRAGALDGFIELRPGDDAPPLDEALRRIAQGAPLDLKAAGATLKTEKFHHVLSPDLLEADALSSRLDMNAARSLAAELLEAGAG